MKVTKHETGLPYNGKHVIWLEADRKIEADEFERKLMTCQAIGKAVAFDGEEWDAYIKTRINAVINFKRTNDLEFMVICKTFLAHRFPKLQDTLLEQISKEVANKTRRAIRDLELHALTWAKHSKEIVREMFADLSHDPDAELERAMLAKYSTLGLG